MVVDINIENFFNGFFDVLYSGITKFFDFSGVGKNNMVVLAIKIGFFVLSLVFSKLVFSNQSAV